MGGPGAFVRVCIGTVTVVVAVLAVALGAQDPVDLEPGGDGR